MPRAVSVLIADDERDIVRTLESILRDEGYATHGVHSGDEVLKRARELREMYQPGTPLLLIAMTGKWTMGSDRLLAGLVGFDHYLLKPCDPQDVLRLLAPLRRSGLTTKN